MDEGGPRRSRHRVAGEIYGTIVYLTLLVLLEEDRTTPRDIIGILLATGFVFWLAHVYAFLIPRIAADGGLRVQGVVETARDQIGILGAVAIPLVPLVLAALGLLSDRAGYRAAIAAGLAALAAFSLREARAAGLPWARALALAGVLLIAGVGLLFLEVSLH
jgi:hypothetical protein